MSQVGHLLEICCLRRGHTMRELGARSSAMALAMPRSAIRKANQVGPNGAILSICLLLEPVQR